MGTVKIIIKDSRVSLEDVEQAIVKEEYTKLGTKMTACTLTLANGFEVVGLAGVVDAKTYSMKIGGPIARNNALDEVWSHLGSILQNELADD